MEISAYAYLLMLALIKIAAFASVAYIIIAISRHHIFSESIHYYKRYFLFAFILTFLDIIVEVFNLPRLLNIMLLLYFGVSFLLLLAIDEKFRRRSLITVFSALLTTFLISSILYTYTLSQYIIVHATGSILLYTTLLNSSVRQARKLHNIGFHIMSTAFMIIIVSSLLEIICIFFEHPGLSYTLAVSSANIGFILVILGFMAKIVMSEYTELNNIALKDSLTQMNNRRGLYYLLETILPSSNRQEQCFSIIAMDIDFFKKVNDTYGHDGGDIVLQAFAKLIKNNHRNTDIAARLGGEEFVLILPNTDASQALKVAEKLRAATETLDIKLNDALIKITSSFGVETSCGNFDLDELFKNADKALYESKFSGRNRVTHFADIQH